MELLDIVDENGIPTGETVERSIAHAKGIRHRTSNVCKSAVIIMILFRYAMIHPARGIFRQVLILKIQHCGNSGKNWGLQRILLN